MSTRPPSHFALRDLRNIPDVILVSLLTNPDYRASMLDGHATLSFPVFKHLWTSLCQADDVNHLHHLMKRHLTTDQRQLVLTSSTSPELLRTLAEHNVLSDHEVRLLPKYVLASVLDYLAIDYYEDNTDLMAYLLPHLRQEVIATYVLRSDPTLFSDSEVLACVEKTYVPYGSANGHDYITSRAIAGVEDLLARRPHLGCMLAKSDDPYVHLALASSRQAALPPVLKALIGKDPRAASSAVLHDEVRDALVRNPVVPYSVRSALNFEGDLYIQEVPADYSTITDPDAIALLVDRALAEGPYFDGTPAYTDIPVLAVHPLLSSEDARRLLERFSVFRDNQVQVPIWRRFGFTQAQATANVLCTRLQMVPQEGSRYRPTPDAKEPVSFATEPAVAVFPFRPPLDFDETIETSFSNAFTRNGPCDAALLIELLGESPTAWHQFFTALDRAPSDTTLRSVVATTKRLVAV